MIAPKVGQTLTPDEAMDEALRVAEWGRGFVSPNPLVGCTIVDSQGKFLSSGAHLVFGGPHAEVNALENLPSPEDAKGATVYVTLEPCSFVGKTPACAKTLVDAGVGKVVAGMVDPHPKVSGKGLEYLKAHGVSVGLFVSYQKKCEHLCEEYVHTLRSDRPYAVLKLAASLDGKIALDNGNSQWITGTETRAHARNLRGQFDATLIGAGTFLNDDPLLDFRDTPFEGKKENRIVLFDPKGKGASFFESSRLVKTHSLENIFVICGEVALAGWTQKGVQAIPWISSEEGWVRVLRWLRQKAGIQSIFVEGGSYVVGQFLKYRLFNKVYLYQAPKILGKGKNWADALQIDDVEKAMQFSDWNVAPVGDDILITARF